jgi:4-hydroxybutyryl-CoA dehydratase/vinylacetyl-CoA-Delta-isomerase
MTGGTVMIESMHGAGSPQAQRIMIFREGDLQNKIKMAKALAGIPTRKGKKKE